MDSRTADLIPNAWVHPDLYRAVNKVPKRQTEMKIEFDPTELKVEYTDPMLDPGSLFQEKHQKDLVELSDEEFQKDFARQFLDFTMAEKEESETSDTDTDSQVIVDDDPEDLGMFADQIGQIFESRDRVEKRKYLIEAVAALNDSKLNTREEKSIFLKSDTQLLLSGYKPVTERSGKPLMPESQYYPYLVAAKPVMVAARRELALHLCDNNSLEFKLQAFNNEHNHLPMYIVLKAGKKKLVSNSLDLLKTRMLSFNTNDAHVLKQDNVGNTNKVNKELLDSYSSNKPDARIMMANICGSEPINISEPQRDMSIGSCIWSLLLCGKSEEKVELQGDIMDHLRRRKERECEFVVRNNCCTVDVVFSLVDVMGLDTLLVQVAKSCEHNPEPSCIGVPSPSSRKYIMDFLSLGEDDLKAPTDRPPEPLVGDWCDEMDEAYLFMGMETECVTDTSSKLKDKLMSHLKPNADDDDG